MKGKGKCLCGSVELEVEYASNELGLVIVVCVEIGLAGRC